MNLSAIELDYDGTIAVDGRLDRVPRRSATGARLAGRSSPASLNRI